MDDRTTGVGRDDRMSGRGDETARGYADRDRPAAYPAGPGEIESGRTGAPGLREDRMDRPEDERRTEEIRAEIDRTREDMSETIDAIQEKLRPANVVAEATDKVKSAARERVRTMTNTASDAADRLVAQGREAGSGIVESARQNPIPAILIGAGTAWMLMGGSRQQSRRYSERPVERMPRQGDGGIVGRIKRHPIPAAIAGGSLAWLALAGGEREEDRWRSRGYRYEYDYDDRYYAEPGTYDEGRLARDRSDTEGGIASEAREKAGELADRTRAAIADTRTTARRTARRTQNALQRLMNDNPLMVGAAAVVIGAVVGAALPETERERELMGEARDSVVEGAQNMARSAVREATEGIVDTVTGQQNK